MPIRGRVWGGYIESTAYPPTPQSKKNISKKVHFEKISSECVSVLYTLIYTYLPPHQTGYATLVRLKILN